MHYIMAFICIGSVGICYASSVLGKVQYTHVRGTCPLRKSYSPELYQYTVVGAPVYHPWVIIPRVCTPIKENTS